MKRPASSAWLSASGSLWLALVALSAPSHAQQETRHADAHVHGAGTLSVAIEGGTVQMEFEAPGADIVGFEHAAKSNADRKALADATAALRNPLALFVLSPAARCTPKSADVAFATEPGHDDHAEFRATYVLTCADIDGLTAITFPYFQRFTNAEKLAVTVIGPSGQTRGEATRGNPLVDLAGLI